MLFTKDYKGTERKIIDKINDKCKWGILLLCAFCFSPNDRKDPGFPDFEEKHQPQSLLKAFKDLNFELTERVKEKVKFRCPGA